MVRVAHKQALEAVQEVPIEECESFLARARSPSRGVGLQACGHHPERRVVREEVERVEGPCTDNHTTAGQLVRGSVVAEHGVSIVGASRQFEGSSKSGLSRSKSQAGMSSRRLRSTLRRGDARVDRGATEGSSSGHCGSSQKVSQNSCPKQRRSGSR